MLKKEEENKKLNKREEMGGNSQKVDSSKELKRTKHKTVIVQPVVALSLQAAPAGNVTPVLVGDIVWVVAAVFVFIFAVVDVLFNSRALDAVASAFETLFRLVVAFELADCCVQKKAKEKRLGDRRYAEKGHL